MPGRTILVVVAHPDDAELSCAGAVARWTREGSRAVLLVATNGARGGKYRDADHASMAQLRWEEQQEAAKVIGFEEVVSLDFADGELQNDMALRSALVEQIRRIRADTAILLDPLTVIHRNSYVNHRDHRMLGMAMLDAMYPEASNAGYYPEQLERGLEPHKVPGFLLALTDQPNYWVDVSDTLDIRFDALRCHRSQIRLWPENGEAVIRQQREWAAVLGLERGVRYVEEYRRVVVNPLA
jgi:LmbE family N-acetylglucosaminyl deacetylase